MDLAALCDSYGYVELKMAAVDTIWLILVLMEDLPATLWLPTTPALHPFTIVCGIGYTSKKPSNMLGNSVSYPFCT